MASQNRPIVTLQPPSPLRRLSPSGHAPSKSPSPKRHAFAARELDPLLTNLSPSATLEALKASNVVDGAADSKHRLLTDSIAGVSQSERALGIRAAVAAKKLREWHAEIKEWPWPSRQFEPPALSKERQALQQSHNGSINQVLVADQFVDDRYDMTYWGSLPAKTVQQHEARLEEIQDGLEALEIEDLKNYIRKAHLLTSKGSEASLNTLYSSDSASSNTYTKLDDFTVVITATIMQALPYLSRLSSLIELWQTRLLVLRQVPVFLHQLEDAQTVMNSAKAALSPAASDITRDSYQAVRDILSSRTNALAQTLDNMLDILEGRPDTLPDHWIDDMEDVERAYQNWVVEAEQTIMAQELNDLRSLKVDSPVGVNEPAQESQPLARKPSSLTDRSQSEATAIGEEEPSGKSGDSAKKSMKQPPGPIDLSKITGWAETEAIKQEAARQISRRSSFSYSDISEEPEVVQTAQVQYVSLSPLVSSPGIKPSIVDISSRSSKPPSHASEPTSPALTRTGSDSTRSSNELRYESVPQPEAGVSGPPAVLAPWPPRRNPARERAASQTQSINSYEAFYDSSDSEAEGGLRSYGSSSFSPARGQGQVSTEQASHVHSNGRFDEADSGPALSVDDFFDSIVQPLSDTSSPSPILLGQLAKSNFAIPARESSQRNKSRPKTSFRAVSPPSHSDNIEAQLNSRISNLLNRIPAPIRFFSGPEDDATEFPTLHTPTGEFPTSPVPADPRTPASLKLAPARFASRQQPPYSAASSSRSSQSEVKLYHLHQPGRMQPIKLYVRLVGENGERVMVRVGGGWSDLGEYLHEYAAHHGRYATIEAGGADLELKDLPASSSSAWSSGRMASSTHHTSRSASPAVLGIRNANVHVESSSHPQQHSGRTRRVFSTGSALTPDRGSQIKVGSSPASTSASSSTGQLKVSKIRREPRSDSRFGTVTPPLQLEDSLSFALGPAGPAAKPKDISPKKKAWVEGVMSQARKVSGSGTKLIRVDDYVEERPSTSGSTRRVYFNRPSQVKMKGRGQ